MRLQRRGMGFKSCGGMNGTVQGPIYMPFSAVASPLQQVPSQFASSVGYGRYWFPPARIFEAGWNQAVNAVIPFEASMWQEVVDWPLPAGVQDVAVPFQVEKISPCILLSGPVIVNQVDENPLTGVTFTVFNLSTNMIGIQLNALLDSPNYRFQTLARVVG